jgi:large subunit ribosomal protein L10
MNDKPVSKNREKKQVVVEELALRVGKAKGLVFTNYQGLTHKQIETLKKAIKPFEADFSITKNTLLKLALKKENLKTPDDKSLDGPTGTLFLYADIIEPLKRLAKSIKDFSLPTIKFGILDGQALTAEQVLRLSSLPSREVLLAQLVGQMKSPISSLHRALNWNLQKFVLTLNAIASSKPSTASAEPITVVAEEPKEEPQVEKVEEVDSEKPQEENQIEDQKSEGGEN